MKKHRWSGDARQTCLDCYVSRAEVKYLRKHGRAHDCDSIKAEREATRKMMGGIRA